jgi:hypothetical protein
MAQVKIMRNGTNLSVSADPKHVDPGETLTFCCDDDFVVFFKNNRDPHSVSTRRIVPILGGCSVPLPIRHLTMTEKQHPDDPILGNKFSYGLAVFVAPAGPILTLKDPDIIIDDVRKDKKNAAKKTAPKKGKKS